MYSFHLFLISSASTRSPPFLSFTVHFFGQNAPIARLAGAQEAVRGAGVDHGLERLARLLHGLARGRDPGGDARVALAVEAVDGAGDRREGALLLRRSAVEHVRRGEVRAVRGELE